MAKKKEKEQNGHEETLYLISVTGENKPFEILFSGSAEECDEEIAKIENDSIAERNARVVKAEDLAEYGLGA